LPKTADPDHMRSNAAVDFEISEEDMATLKDAAPIAHYGESSHFPVFGGKA
jgi:diketogulonate reductase-like aldo/keto reductase